MNRTALTWKRSIRASLIIVASISLGFLSGIVVSKSSRRASSSKNHDSLRGLLEISSTVRDHPLRFARAAEGARDESNLGWQLLVLSNPEVLCIATDDEVVSAVSPDAWNRGLAAEIILNLPQNPEPLILMSLTLLLSEDRDGRVTRSRHGILGANTTGYSPPLRELSRDTLRRCLGVDWEYDAEQWRKEILLRFADVPK